MLNRSCNYVSWHWHFTPPNVHLMLFHEDIAYFSLHLLRRLKETNLHCSNLEIPQWPTIRSLSEADLLLPLHPHPTPQPSVRETIGLTSTNPLPSYPSAPKFLRLSSSRHSNNHRRRESRCLILCPPLMHCLTQRVLSRKNPSLSKRQASLAAPKSQAGRISQIPSDSRWTICWSTSPGALPRRFLALRLMNRIWAAVTFLRKPSLHGLLRPHWLQSPSQIAPLPRVPRLPRRRPSVLLSAS
jgi:hypothetical protein